MLIDSSISRINEDGNLIIDTRPYLDRQCLITNWNQGVKFYSKQDNQWLLETIDPGLELITSNHLNSKNDPIQNFLQLIPQWLLVQLCQYSYYQFTLIKLLSHYSNLQDIFKHSPVIFWIACIYTQKNQQSIEVISKFLHQKRTTILFKIVGNDSKKVLKFIQKLELKQGSQREYELICNALKRERIIDKFKHCSSISVQEIGIAMKFPDLTNHKIIKAYLNENYDFEQNIALFSKVRKLIKDVKNMANVERINLPLNYFEQFKCKKDLQKAHDLLVKQVNQRKISRHNSYALANSPLKDSETIIQIRKSVDLLLEGQLMHHCVGGYIGEAFYGNSYFYRVMYPERATLQIQVVSGVSRITQFKLACNQKPSDESWIAVKQWLGKKTQ